MHRYVRWTVIAACLLLAVLAVAAQEGGTEVVGGDESALRQMLAQVVGQMGYPGSAVTVLIGEIPETLPLALPIPEDARIIGSIMREEGIIGSEIMLQSSEPFGEVLAWFTEAMAAENWNRVEVPMYPNNGFTNNDVQGVQFCNSRQDAMILLEARAAGTGSDLHMYVYNYADASMCDPVGEAAFMMSDPYLLLPQLLTPDGVKLIPSHGGGSGGGGSVPGYRSASNTVFLESELPLADITSAYQEQLNALGWQASGAETGEKSAWSGWTFNDEDGKVWGGTLTMVASQTGAGEYLATIMVQEIPDET